jgi:hypothetical protein
VKVVVVDFSRGVPLRITAEHKGRLPEETTRPQVPSSLNKALLKLVVQAKRFHIRSQLNTSEPSKRNSKSFVLR